MAYSRFVEAVRDNPRRVIYMEVDVGEMEYSCVKGLKRAMRDGSVGDGEEVLSMRDAIVILSSESTRANNHCCASSSSSSHHHEHIKSTSGSRSSTSRDDDDDDEKQEEEEEEEEEEERQNNGKLDLNIMASGGELGDEDDTAASVHSEIMRGISVLVDKQLVFAIQVL